MHTGNSTAAIIGMGIITPEIHEMADLPRACSSLNCTIKQNVEQIPTPQGMNIRSLRRTARLTHLALYAADKAAQHAGVKGQNGSLYVGLTHGSTSLLQEFHDYLFKYGPRMASPNAFSNGVTNAPLGAISKQLGLTHGGGTLVGYETCGMDILHFAAEALDHGISQLCIAGAAEEFSPFIADTYAQCNRYNGVSPPHLPQPLSANKADTGFLLSEAGIFFVLSSIEYAEQLNRTDFCLFTPVDSLNDGLQEIDIIISGAGGGPQDVFELKALSTFLSRRKKPAGILFSKCFFGETAAAGPLLSSAMAWDILINKTVYPAFPVHPSLKQYTTAITDVTDIGKVLVISASRDGDISAGVLALPKAKI